jgi:curved DNA-binding protein CbpA
MFATKPFSITSLQFFKFHTTSEVTIEAIKRQYRKLAMANHPDRGGDLRTMQAINAEFDVLRKRFYNVHEGENGGTYVDETAEGMDDVTARFTDIIDALMKLGGVEIEICGSFVWLGGNTYEHRAAIKALGFRWASRKKRWYLAPEGWRKRGGNEWSMNRIRGTYGSQVVGRKSPAALCA